MAVVTVTFVAMIVPPMFVVVMTEGAAVLTTTKIALVVVITAPMVLTVTAAAVEVVVVLMLKVLLVGLTVLGSFVASALGCPRSGVGAFVEVLADDVSFGVVVFLPSDEALDLFMDAAADVTRDFLIDIGVVGMLVDANVNAFASATTAFELAMSVRTEDFRG